MNFCGCVVAIPNLFMVETVDSAKLATALDAACQKCTLPRSERLKIMVQVNTSREPSQYCLLSLSFYHCWCDCLFKNIIHFHCSQNSKCLSLDRNHIFMQQCRLPAVATYVSAACVKMTDRLMDRSTHCGCEFHCWYGASTAIWDNTVLSLKTTAFGLDALASSHLW